MNLSPRVLPYSIRSVFAFLFVLASAPLALASQESPAPAISSPLEKQRLEVERQRLELERKRLDMERTNRLVTLGAVAVPLVVAWLTLRAQARSAFDLKAAELVLGAPSPWAAEARAAVLQQLFPRRLPANFAQSFDKRNFPGARKYEMKLEILRQLIEHPDRKGAILEDWQRAFPGDAWIGELGVAPADPAE